MKKTSVFIIFLSLLFGGLFFYFLIPKKDSQVISSWKTYVRLDKTPQISMAYPTTVSEMSLTKTADQRSPASAATVIPKGKFKIGGRDLFGDKIDDIKSEADFESKKDTYYFENEVSDVWEKNFADNQLRIMDPDTKLMIKKDASLIQIKKNRVRYLEILSVNVIKDGNNSNSFTAMVDSQTGKLLNTWNLTIHENNNELKNLKFTVGE